MSNERNRIYAKVQQIIEHQLDVSSDAIHEGASLVDDLGADSLAVVEMVLAIEEQFGISIPDEEAEKIRTVGEAVTYIERNVRSSAAE